MHATVRWWRKNTRKFGNLKVGGWWRILWSRNFYHNHVLEISLKIGENFIFIIFFGTSGTLTINSHNLNLLKIRYNILSPPGIQFISGNLFIVITILLVCLEPNISKVQKNYSGWRRYDATLAAYSNLKTSKNPLLRNAKKTESPFIIIFIIRGKAFQTIIPEELLELNGSKFDHI